MQVIGGFCLRTTRTSFPRFYSIPDNLEMKRSLGAFVHGYLQKEVVLVLFLPKSEPKQMTFERSHRSDTLTTEPYTPHAMENDHVDPER